MKTKIKLFAISILFLSVQLLASTVSITSPDNNQTLYITSGTSRSVTMKWNYTTDPDTIPTSWYFRVYRLGTWTNAITSTELTVNGVTSGTHTWKVRLYKVKSGNTTLASSDAVTFYVTPATYSITAQNNFSGGQIKVGINNSPSTVSSPHTFSASVNNTVYLEAVDNQFDGTYSRIWNDDNASSNPSNWWKRPYNGSFSFFNNGQSTDFVVNSTDKNAIYQANLRKVCNVTFQNNFVGVGNGGTIKVNGAQQSSPTSQFSVVEGNEISASAMYHVINGIEYLFDHWSDGSTVGYNHTFTPNVHQTYTAYFNGRPNNSYRNLHFNTGDPVGTPIKLYWNEHPNTAVTKYQIWRKHGKFGSYQLLATVNRGVQNHVYTDYDYSITSNHTTDNLTWYDVRAYYSTENSYAEPDYLAIYGELMFKQDGEQTDSLQIEPREKITENSLSSFPNPFNPTTTVYYKLKEKSHVVIKVYDMLGKEVATLVNEEKPMGDYIAKFNGSKLSSGIYIVNMQTGKTAISQKIILSK